MITTLKLQQPLANLFQYEQVPVKIIGSVNNPWFCGKHVCEILQYTDIKQTLRTHVKPIYKRSYVDISSEFNIEQNANTLEAYREGKAVYVNEPGLYALIFGSRLETAEKFRTWVFEDVLPSIRKECVYKLEQSIKEYEDKLVESTKALAIVC